MHNIAIKIISAILAIACLLTFSDVALCSDFIPVKAHDTLALDSQIRTAEFSAIFSELYIGHAIADACRLNITSENGVKDLITAHRSRLPGPAASNRIGSFDLKNLQVRREGDSYYLIYTNALDGNRISCRYFVLPSGDSVPNAIRICDFESSCVKRTVWMEVANATSVPVKAGPLAAAEASVMDAKTPKGAGVILKDEAPKPKPAGVRLLGFAKKLESIHAEVKKIRRLRKNEHFYLIRAPKILRRAKLILDKDGPEEAFAPLVYMWKVLNCLTEKFEEYGRLTGIEFHPDEYEEFLVWWAKELYPTKPGLAFAVHLQLAKFSLDAIPLSLLMSRDSEMDIDLCALIDEYKALFEEFYEDSPNLSESINDSTGAPNRITNWRLYLLAIHKIDKIVYNIGEFRQKISNTPGIPKKLSQYFLNDDSPLYRAQQHLVHVQHYAKMLQASSGENGPQSAQTRTQEGEPPLLGGGAGGYVIARAIKGTGEPSEVARLIVGDISGGTITKDETALLLAQTALSGYDARCNRVVESLKAIGCDISDLYDAHRKARLNVVWQNFGGALDKMISYLRYYAEEPLLPERDDRREAPVVGLYAVLELFTMASRAGAGEVCALEDVVSMARIGWNGYFAKNNEAVNLYGSIKVTVDRFHQLCAGLCDKPLSSEEICPALEAVLKNTEAITLALVNASVSILEARDAPDVLKQKVADFIENMQELVASARQEGRVGLSGYRNLIMNIDDEVSNITEIYADMLNYIVQLNGNNCLRLLKDIRELVNQKLAVSDGTDISGSPLGRASDSPKPYGQHQVKRPPFGPYYHAPDPGDDEPSVENPVPIPKPVGSYAGINEARKATAVDTGASAHKTEAPPADFTLPPKGSEDFLNAPNDIAIKHHHARRRDHRVYSLISSVGQFRDFFWSCFKARDYQASKNMIYESTGRESSLMPFFQEIFKKARFRRSFADDTRIVFLSAGADPLYEIAKAISAIVPGLFPPKRIHKVWATMGNLRQINRDPDLAVRFVRYLHKEGILTSETKRIIFVDTDSRINEIGTEVLIYKTLLNVEAINAANIPGVQPWNAGGENSAEIFYMTLGAMDDYDLRRNLNKYDISLEDYRRMGVDNAYVDYPYGDNDLWFKIDTMAKCANISDVFTEDGSFVDVPVYGTDFSKNERFIMQSVQYAGLVMQTLNVLEALGFDVKGYEDRYMGELSRRFKKRFSDSQSAQTRTQEGEPPPLLGGGTGIYVIEQSIIKDTPEVTATLIRGNIVGGTMTVDETVQVLAKMSRAGHAGKCDEVASILKSAGIYIEDAYRVALSAPAKTGSFTVIEPFTRSLRAWTKTNRLLTDAEREKLRVIARKLDAIADKLLDSDYLSLSKSEAELGRVSNISKGEEKAFFFRHLTIHRLSGVAGKLLSLARDWDKNNTKEYRVCLRDLSMAVAALDEFLGSSGSFRDFSRNLADEISFINDGIAAGLTSSLRKSLEEFLPAHQADLARFRDDLQIIIDELSANIDSRPSQVPGEAPSPRDPNGGRPFGGPYYHTPDPGDDEPSVENPVPVPKPATSYADINEARAPAARRFTESYLDGGQVPADFPLTADIVSPGFGERVKKIRKAFGVSKIDFAVMLGITQGAIDYWGKGGTLPKSYNMIAAFAEKYEIPMKYLLKGEGEKEALESANKHKEEFRRGVLPQAPAKKLPRVDMTKQKKAAQRFAAIRANEAAVFAILSEVPVDVMGWALPRAKIVSCALARRYKENDRLVYWSYAIEGFALAYRAYVLKGCDGGKLDPRSERFKRIADAAMRNAIADSARHKSGQGRFMKSGVFLFSEAFTGEDAYDDKSFRSKNIPGKSELPTDKFDQSGVPDEILNMLRRDGLPAFIQSVDTLTSDERFVLARFIKNDESTLEKIAREMRSSKSSVFRIYKSAINKIQDYVMKKNAQVHSRIAAQRKAVAAEGVGKSEAAPRQARDGVLSTTTDAVQAIDLMFDMMKDWAYGERIKEKASEVGSGMRNIIIAVETPDRPSQEIITAASHVVDKLRRDGIIDNRDRKAQTVNVVMVHGATPEQLYTNVIEAQRAFNAPDSNIAIMGSRKTLECKFASLQNKALFSYVDYAKSPDLVASLTITIEKELGVGEEVIASRHPEIAIDWSQSPQGIIVLGWRIEPDGSRRQIQHELQRDILQSMA